jgi:putative FmdB family regulatory protein
MPTYDYKCDHCDYEFEVKQKMSDEPLTFCPVCNKEKVKKIFKSANKPILKGSGWTGQRLTK